MRRPLLGVLFLRRPLYFGCLARRDRERPALQTFLEKVLNGLRRYQITLAYLGTGKPAFTNIPAHRVQCDMQFFSSFLLRQPSFGAHSKKYSVRKPLGTNSFGMSCHLEKSINVLILANILFSVDNA